MKKRGILSTLLAMTLAMTMILPVSAEEYRSELSGKPIDISLQTQRPIAVMVDNEKTALQHYGVGDADIVYEMMNSTANGRVTRLMCIFKDWRNISQLGSIRSARPTNFMIAAEYNAILVHDGGPFYINPYVAAPYTNNLSGGFARFSNGKRTEFTEYVTSNGYTNPTTKKSYAGLINRIAAKKYSPNYNEWFQGQHFQFAEAEYSPASIGGTPVNSVAFPFPHNGSTLTYNAAKGSYDYAEYGMAHVDARTKIQTTFKNVIIQCAPFTQYDVNGYMVYNISGNAGAGYFMTDGYAVPITWSKEADHTMTKYTLQDGTPITLNTGNTYIALVPSDVWGSMILK